MRRGTIIYRGTTQFPVNIFSVHRHFPVCNVYYTAMPTVPFSNAAPVGNSDICLNGKRLTADDLFSLAENSILKTRSSLLISFMIQVCLSCSDIHSL